jgi:hypothetical protein
LPSHSKVGQHTLGVLFEQLAGISEFDPPSPPLKKICPAPVLELAYVQRDGRLAKMKHFGSPREILQTCAFEKNSKAVRVHGCQYIILIYPLTATIKSIDKQIRNLYWTAADVP